MDQPEKNEQILKEMISKHLDQCCEPGLKLISKFISTPVGRQRAENIIFEMCSTQGIAVPTAISLLDSDLPVE
jgi:hypothetical protein